MRQRDLNRNSALRPAQVNERLVLLPGKFIAVADPMLMPVIFDTFAAFFC